MLYFRSLPEYSLLFRMMSSVFLTTTKPFEVQFKHRDFTGSSELPFRKSRDGINFLFDHYYQQKGRKLQVWLPSLFCWEIVNEFNHNQISVNWYPVDKHFRPDWEFFNTNKSADTVDVFFTVSFFGIPSDIVNARKFAKEKSAVLFIDETHSTLPSVKPLFNEFVFLSWYKQFPVPNGAVVLCDPKLNQEVMEEFAQLQAEGSIVHDLIWILKSIYIKVSKRMPFLPNTYTDEIGETPECAVHVKKGMSALSSSTILTVLRKSEGLKHTYAYYKNEVEKHCAGMSFEFINFNESNSHLFGIRFNSLDDVEKAYDLLVSNKIPVVTWPQKKYITMIPDSMKAGVQNAIDTTLFLCAFYNSLGSETK